jgi:hypothetical protein
MDAEQALAVDLIWCNEIIAEVSEIRDGDMSIRDEESLTFDEWCQEEDE